MNARKAIFLTIVLTAAILAGQLWTSSRADAEWTTAAPPSSPPAETLPPSAPPPDTTVVADATTPETAPVTTAPIAATDPSAPTTTGPGEMSGPSMSLDATEMAPGGRVIVTLDGFGSLWATVMVCGNEARRGSPDCNQIGSTTKEFPTDGSPLRVSLAISSPPADCPCVVRAVGRDTSEIAIAPIVITGHPVGPVVEPTVTGPLMRVEIDASLSSSGLGSALRAQLGGPAVYDVTVRVTNTSTSPLRAVQLSVTAVRGDTIAATPTFDDPGQIGVGQTWSQTVTAELPAPSFGETEWRATASGAGPIVDIRRTTAHRPWMLIAMALLVVLNIGILLMRWRVRRRLDPARAGRETTRTGVRGGSIPDSDGSRRRPAVGSASARKSSPARH